MSATVAPMIVEMESSGDAASLKGASHAGDGASGAVRKGDVATNALVQPREASTGAPPSPFGRHLMALLRKNFLLQRRVPGTTLLELILPILFVGLMSAIWAPPTFNDVVQAQPREYTGMGVPVWPLQCLAARLSHSQQMIAVVPHTSAQKASADVLARTLTSAYPSMNASALFPNSPVLSALGDLPALSSVLSMQFTSEAALDAYVTQTGYGKEASIRKLWAAIVVYAGPWDAGAATKTWDYALRFNTSDLTVDTVAPLYNPYQIAPSDPNFYAYWSITPSFEDVSFGSRTNSIDYLPLPGFSSLQLAVDRAIINRTAPSQSADPVALARLAATAFSVMSIDGSSGAALGQEWFVAQSQMRSVDSNISAQGAARSSQLLLALTDFMKAESSLPQQVTLVPFPVTGFRTNDFYGLVQGLLSLFVTLSFLFPVSRLIRAIVAEKEARLKEGMLQMGMSSFALSASWVITYGMLFVVIAAGCATLTVGTFLARTDWSVVFVVFLLLGWGATAWCFLISTFFSAAKTASSVGVATFFVLTFPLSAATAAGSSVATKLACAIASNTAFGLTMNVLATFEKNGNGVRWKDIGDIVENWTVAGGMAIMAFDIVLYLTLGLYFDAVLPRAWGVPRPWYFPFTRSFWTEVYDDAAAFFHQADEHSLLVAVGEVPASNAFTQPLDSDQAAKLKGSRALSARSLLKTFATPDGRKTAVDKINIDVFEGQILCLLGHNGAGKTTTISILTGMLKADAGTMSVFGLDLRTKPGMRMLRSQLGVCPQHDVLWPELTVMEHLQLFADIKGVSPLHQAAEIAKAISDVGLTEKAHSRSSALSGGMKRKLSVAIALLGGSKVVVLDEPTSGMDPYSRRSTWQMLQKAREGRIVLLTTHFMDEADVLADRIAIMADGRVRCVGSPVFLKRAFNVGYVLTCAMLREEGTSIASRRATAIDDIVREHVPVTASGALIGSELTVRLPFDASNLPALFRTLESGSAALGIASFSVSVTTSEAIFLRVAKEADAERTSAGAVGELLSAPLVVDEGIPVGEADGQAVASWDRVIARARRADSGPRIFGEHMWALLAKRGSAARRDYRNVFCAVLVPVLTLLFGFWILSYAPFAPRPSLEMSTANYNVDNRGNADKPLHPFLLPAFTFKHGYAGAVGSTSNTTIALAPHRSFSPDLLNVMSCMAPGNVSSKTDTGTSMWLDARGTDAILQGDPLRFVNPTSNLPDSQAMSSILIQAKAQSAGSTFGAVVWEAQGGGSSLFPASRDDDAAGLRPAMNGTPAAAVGEYVLLLNTTAWHAAGLMANLVNSALYAWSLLPANAGSNETGSAGCMWASQRDTAVLAPARIVTRNFPLPLTASQQDSVASFVSGSGSTFALIGLSFVPAAVAAGVVKERETGAKHQQRISGVSVAAYWLSHWMFDYFTYISTALASIGVYALFEVDVFIGLSDGKLGSLFALYFLFGAAIIPFAYLVSFAFRSHSSAQNSVLVITVITGAVLCIMDFILANVPTAGGKACQAEISLQGLWRLFPAFSLGHGLYRLSYLSVLPAINANCPRALGKTISFDDLKAITAWHPTATGTDIVYLACMTVVYLLLVIALDTALGMPNIRLKMEALFSCRLRAAFCTRASDADDVPETEEEEDADVASEAARVAADGAREDQRSTTDVIQLRRLRKVYPPGAGGGRTGGKPKVAVRDLSFGVPVGEVFGFLGINGAGKSTSMGVITGEQLPTRGTAVLAGFDIVKQQPEVRKLVGFCPQFDALLDNLTLSEHLWLYARLKGIPSTQLASTVAASMAELGISEFAGKLAARLSGGTKRKLCLAIALIGRPPLLVLDEPTTGVDAVSRRHIWSTLQKIANRDRLCSIMLTTHSMEEAEALCTRIGIMVGGRLRCLGSAQHLKDKFGSGYQLDVRLRAPSPAEIAIFTASAYAAQPSGTTADAARDGSRMVNEAEGRSLCALMGAPTRAGEPEPSKLGAVEPADTSASYGLRAVFAAGALPLSAFAEWYVLEDFSDACTRLVNETFAGASLIERHGGSLRFSIPSSADGSAPRALSDMFEALESGRARLGCIEGFSLGQTSLEQVFVSLAGAQEEETGPMPGQVAVKNPASALMIRAPPA